jgi:hypothetical protein
MHQRWLAYSPNHSRYELSYGVSGMLEEALGELAAVAADSALAG